MKFSSPQGSLGLADQLKGIGTCIFCISMLLAPMWLGVSQLGQAMVSGFRENFMMDFLFSLTFFFDAL